MIKAKRAFLTWVLVVPVVVVCSSNSRAQERPYRGSIPWSILLCKFSDSPTPPHDANYYRDMTITTGQRGLADYVSAISYGKVDLGGSVVQGWYTESHTLAYEQGLSSRWQRVQDCLDTAAASPADPYTPPAGQRVYVITSPGVDLAGWENTAAIGGDDVALPEIAHEFGHGIGLNHSWSNDITWKDASWAGPGEYDNPWDLMSAANVYVDPTGVFGGGPPDLDAHHLDEMGWIPKSRIFTLGVDGILSRTLTLAALTHPNVSGYLLIRVPFDSNDRFHYYTLEYRTPDTWDSGIPASILMMNEIENNTSYYQTTLMRQLGSYAGTGDGPPLQTISANGVIITVQSTSGDQATVQVSTEYALPCTQGYVWREASSIDRVCVTPATRSQAAADNAAASSRHLPNSTTCVQGYVWREAYPGDYVCVTPATRAQAHTDDANAYYHVNEGLVAYGPNTCQQGYVWRDGDDNDYVCVTGQVRDQTVADNAAAASRHVSGSDTCIQGYVWRVAWPGDHVCVTPTTRSQAQSDNSQTAQRLWNLWAAMPRIPRHLVAEPSFRLVEVGERAPRQMREATRPGPQRKAAPQMARGQQRHPGELHTPAPVSEAVLRVRLAKMGYPQVQKLDRTGNYWEATVVKNGVTHVLRFHIQAAERPSEVIPRR